MIQASMISALRLNGPTVDDPPTIFLRLFTGDNMTMITLHKDYESNVCRGK